MQAVVTVIRGLLIRRFFWIVIVATVGDVAFAQSSTPDADAWITNGVVRTIVHAYDTTYIGGDFSYVGPDTGAFVPVSAVTGLPLSTKAKVRGIVYTCCADGSGGWYIGGTFEQVGTLLRNNIAHILANGEVDSTWNPNATLNLVGGSAAVYTLVLSDDTLYVGGRFSHIGGQARSSLASLNAKTGLATEWYPNASNWTSPVVISAMALLGRTVYVNGAFGSIGGQTRYNFAAVDTVTGLATDWNPDLDGSISEIVASGTTVYVGGLLSQVNGNYGVPNVAAIDATTGLVSTWSFTMDDYVHDMILSPNGHTLYLGVNYYNWSGASSERGCFVAVDLATGQLTNVLSNISGNAYAMAISGDGTTIHVGGNLYDSDAGKTCYVAEINTTTGASTGWDPSVGGEVYALALSGGTVFVGGDFASVGVKWRNNIAALDETGVPTQWDPSASGTVQSLAVSGGCVYVGGAFSGIGGEWRFGLAALDAVGGGATSWDPSINGTVYSVEVLDKNVYVAGSFSSVDGYARYNLAAIDATTGVVTDWSPGPNGTVYDLGVSGITVYAGGAFTTVGGQARSGLAAIDTATGLATAWNPNPSCSTSNPSVSALAISDNVAYVGGTFTSIGGQTRFDLAAVDITTGLATAWNPSPVSSVSSVINALAVGWKSVYVGGNFEYVGGQLRHCVASLDPTTGLATSWSSNANDNVLALAVLDASIYIGGSFSNVHGDFRPSYAQFGDAPTPLIATFTLDDPSPTDLDTVRFSVDFNKPLLSPLAASDVTLTTSSLPGTIQVSGADPSYTVAVTFLEPNADGMAAIAIPAGAVSDLHGQLYTGGYSQPYLIWNAPMPATGPVGLAALLVVVSIAGARRLRRG